MSKLDVEIDPAKLGDTPIYPPRRTWLDFVPTNLKIWVRRKYNILPATKREVWILESLFLRIFYNTQRVNQLIEQTPKPFHTSELPKQSKPYEPAGGWN